MVNNKKKNRRRNKRSLQKDACPRCSQSSITLDSEALSKLEIIASNGVTQTEAEEVIQSGQVSVNKPAVLFE